MGKFRARSRIACEGKNSNFSQLWSSGLQKWGLFPRKEDRFRKRPPLSEEPKDERFVAGCLPVLLSPLKNSGSIGGGVQVRRPTDPAD
jgi:hypothetical protein